MRRLMLTERTEEINSRLLEGEKHTSYPFGDDRFYISHGDDYFKFFRRLGTPYWAVTIDSQKKILSQLCAILRKVPLASGKLQKSWYLCDLKKDRHHRSANTLSALFRTVFCLIWKCQRGYAISMNRDDGLNPLNLVIKKAVFLPRLSSAQLMIFSCSYEQLLTIRPIIEKYRGPVSYLNLAGVKDIILQKGGKLSLLHLQFGPMKSRTNTLPSPLPHFTYMWCSPASDPLSIALIKANCIPSATATIFSWRMKHHDWSWILTSDI